MMVLDDIDAAAAHLGAAFERARRAVVLTGAGLSTESGVPDYRGPDGLWKTMRPIEFDAFVSSEAARLADWERRFAMADLLASTTPNAAHLALAELVGDGRIELVVTQNIDGLHERAGTPADRLVELHGNGTRAACLECAAPVTLAEARRHVAQAGTSPCCVRCGGLVKATVVSFGQGMPRDALLRADTAARSADLFVALGTSLVVYPAAALPENAKAHGAELIIASRDPTPLDELADCVVRTPLAATFARCVQPRETNEPPEVCREGNKSNMHSILWSRER